MPSLPPLRFEPILRDYLWGGRRLAELGKRVGDGPHYAESWEVVDHGRDQSVVVGGPLAGVALHEIVSRHSAELFGRHHPQSQFPLLFKYLDCQRTLSVQVHPNNEQAARLEPPDRGKTEAWLVLEAAPGSKIYAGLKTGVDRHELERAVDSGTCEQCLHAFEPRPGNCLLIEARTVHALGGGLLVAEIQQASDITYRLFDWNRVDRDGKPRPLHIAQSLDTIDFSRGPIAPTTPRPTVRSNVERLAACEKFVLDCWTLDKREAFTSDDRFHILTAIDGRLAVIAKEQSYELNRGDTLLVPACCQDAVLEPQGRAVLLDMYLPE
jgi:mannose-6-phosphate isomerase